MATWYNEERVKQPGSVILKAFVASREAARAVAQQAARQVATPPPARLRGMPVEARLHQSRVRSFAGGAPSRLTANFIATNTSLDADLYAALDTLRARSRALAQNNPYGAKFLKMVAANVVGAQGFTLQARAADIKIANGKPLSIPDAMANRAIEAAFAEWSQIGICDLSGKLSFRSLCAVAMRAVAGDGEMLVRRVRGKSVNRFGYALQILDIDRLEVSDNRRLDNGHIVRMGVEIDAYGRPAAYWLRTTHPGENGPAASPGVARERIPAADIFHCFVPLRPEQRRGVPWMHAAIESLYHLGEFDQSVLVAARKGADTLGFFVSPDGQPAEAGDAEEPPIEISAPGTFDTLPEGYDLRPYESKYPSELYGSFVKDNLRRIASGFNVAYNGLANDLEGVNFSSIRAGLLDEREFWMDTQQWLIECFLTPVFTDWLQMALGLGAVVMENGSALPATKLFKFQAHTWQGRRWPWVDPEKDISAAILAIEAGLDSPQRIAAQQGRDTEDILDDIAAFQAMAKAKGVTLGKSVPTPPDRPSPPPAPPA